MKRLLVSALCAASVLGSGTAFAQSSSTAADEQTKVGSAGGQFLKIGVGARATGMGGAYSGLSNDITSIYWNSAGIADVEGISANFSYTQWFAGLSHNFVAASMPVGEQYRAAISITSFTSGDIPVTTLQNPNGTGTNYSLSDLAIGLTFGGKLTDQFSFGITGKYVQQSFSSVSSTGVVFDIGTMYRTDLQGLRIGFSINNLGSEFRYSGQDLVATTEPTTGLGQRPTETEIVAKTYSMPLSFRAGIAADVFEDDEVNKLVVAADFETLSDAPEQYAIGAEYTWNDFVSVRAGYRVGQEQLGVAAGAGLKYESGGFKGSIDYSINPTTDFGLLNRLSLNINLY